MERVERAKDAGEPGTIEWVPDELREQSAAPEAGETTEWAAALAPSPETDEPDPAAAGAEAPDPDDDTAADDAAPEGSEPGAPDDPEPAEPPPGAAGEPGDGVVRPPEPEEVVPTEHRVESGLAEKLLAGMQERLDELQRGQDELSERIAGIGSRGASGDRVAELATVLEDLAAQLEQAVSAERLARKRALEELSSRVAELGGREAEERRRLGDRLIRHCDDSIEHLLESSRHEGEERRWLQGSFETRLATLEGAVERISELVSDVAARSKPVAQPAAPPAAAPEPPEEQPEALRGADLNSLTFEQLRVLGLSITQASRLLATRERLGGFTELDQIDDVAGFPKGLRERLKAELTIGT